MNILADADLPGLFEAFPAPFKLTLYTDPFDIPQLLHKQDVLLCRSTLKVNSTLLGDHHLYCVATASSGTDHIDASFLKSKNICLMDAKGCNAQSVADYVQSCIAYLDKHHLLCGRTAGIIGMGYVGTAVSQRLQSIQFQTRHYDPLKVFHDFKSCTLEALYECDLLCIHANLHSTEPYPSLNLIDSQFLSRIKPHCTIINASRGSIVDEAALLQAPSSIIYCTDVYTNEPDINEDLIKRATLCTPHIAGHSIEAKYAAVMLISKQLHQALGLPAPRAANPKQAQHWIINQSLAWQEQVLALYHPMSETLQLKQADDKKNAFLNVRKNHQTRHEFVTF